MDKILEVKNLNQHQFRKTTITFEKSKFYSIVGSNNSGKTALFKVLSGFYSTNNVIICDNVSLKENNKYTYLKKIGVVKQVEDDSFLYQKVLNEIAFPLNNLNYPKSLQKKIIHEVARIFAIEDTLDKSISDLTLFEKQKLLFAIALLHSPRVLLIDDALLLLKPIEKAFLLQILHNLIKENHLTVIYFTSNLNDVLTSDLLIILSHYQIIKIGSVSELMENDQLFIDEQLEIPFMFDLSSKLKIYDLVSRNYSNMEELVNNLWP